MGNLEEETCNPRPSTITSRTSPTSEATCHPRPTSPSSTHSEAAQTVQSSHTPLAGTATSPPSTWHRRPAFLAPHQEPPQLHQPRPLPKPMTLMTATSSAMTMRRKSPSQRRPHRYGCPQEGRGPGQEEEGCPSRQVHHCLRRQACVL